MSSCQLFHGPGAREAALARATKIGRLMAPPFGDDGLSVDEARDIVELLLSTPVGNKIGVVIIGPIDNTKSIRAMDALLKSVEEIPSEWMLPILWADDLGGVIPTIRSRCLEIWAPGPPTQDLDLMMLARQIIDEILADRYYLIPTLVMGTREVKEDAPEEEEPEIVPIPTEEPLTPEKKAKKAKFRGVELLWALSDVLSYDLNNPSHRLLWERLRVVSRWKNPTPIEVVSSLIS